MIKLIIFDLDGVLVETKELHYKALNDALYQITKDYKYNITIDEHLDRYDGLPTNKKLQLLTKEKGLSVELHNEINTLKQQLTFSLIKEVIKPNHHLIDCLKKLKSDGYKLYVASNSIRETVKLLLLYSGLLEWVDFTISNEDVKNAKPNPEIYLKAIIDAGISPDESLIVEDSPRGIEAAQKAKTKLLIVKNPKDLTYDKIIKEINMKSNNTQKLKLNNLNILIPMAGEGSRFKNAGYAFPKPLISINEKTMIQTVVDSLKIEANFIYLVRKEHYEQYNLKHLLNVITPNCKIIVVDKLTEGAACTTLLAKEFIDNDQPLLIANSDQYIEWNPLDFYYKMTETKADGGILTFNSTHPKWSYIKLDQKENVSELAEKVVISNQATVGIYWYNKGSEYVKYTEQMIQKNLRVNGEFYVAPVYNEYILDGKKIKHFDVDEMWGIGVPEDLDLFLKNKKI